MLHFFINECFIFLPNMIWSYNNGDISVTSISTSILGHFINRVLWVSLSNILTMVSPKISSMNGAFTFISFCSLGFKIIQFSENMGTDLFKNLKQQSLEFITPSTLNTFFKPKTKSTFSWISDTSV